MAIPFGRTFFDLFSGTGAWAAVADGVSAAAIAKALVSRVIPGLRR